MHRPTSRILKTIETNAAMTRLSRLMALAAAVIILSGACSAPQTPPSPTAAPAVIDINPRQAFDLIQKNQGRADFIILDVRTPAEYGSGRIAGAVNIDVGAASFGETVGKLARPATYLVYCRTGVRSRQASDIMVSLGFQNVYNMTGGITDWQAAGFPVVTTPAR
jgi:rhodanese-related sulfurtransferase